MTRQEYQRLDGAYRDERGNGSGIVWGVFLVLIFWLACVVMAAAQTLPQPSAPNNTIVCLTVNSTVSIGGQTIGVPPPTCFGLTDTVAAQLIEAYSAPCQTLNLVGTPPVSTACTPSQVLGFLASSIQTGVLANVARYFSDQAKAAAANTVTPPTVTNVGP
jgi:hypothetical protein